MANATKNVRCCCLDVVIAVLPLRQVKRNNGSCYDHGSATVAASTLKPTQSLQTMVWEPRDCTNRGADPSRRHGNNRRPYSRNDLGSVRLEASGTAGYVMEVATQRYLHTQ